MVVQDWLPILNLGYLLWGGDMFPLMFHPKWNATDLPSPDSSYVHTSPQDELNGADLSLSLSTCPSVRQSEVQFPITASFHQKALN